MGTGHDDVPVTQPGVLLSLLSFCTACSIHGVQTRSVVTRHAVRLTRWKPLSDSNARLVAADKSELLRTPEKAAIIAALNDAGLSGAARDAEKIRKAMRLNMQSTI